MMMTADSGEKTSAAGTMRRGGRIARHVRLAGELHRDPGSALPKLRGWFVTLWRAKGSGFYGLGYVVTLIALEARSLTGDIAESTGIASFVTTQLVGYLIRISIESFINLALAVFWPVWIFSWLGWPALFLLVGGYFGFEKLARPWAEARFPELCEGREERPLTRRRWWSLGSRNRG